MCSEFHQVPTIADPEVGQPPGVVEIDNELRANLNISDVFEAISIADPAFGVGAGAGAVEEDAMYRAPADARPYCRIVEQPASKALRFRYECEGRSAGSIPGANSTSEKKTFPTIEIVGHKGRAIVVVSCVTKDHPYKPHPHKLVGRELCKKGICTVNVTAESQLVTFSNLGIQCVKRRDIEEALRVREEQRVDPFKTGFTHKSQPQSIDLNAVRLCFQVFLPDERSGKIRHALPPIVSDVIYDKKAMSDLVIADMRPCSGSVNGGEKVILLCEKVAREDIAVTFYEKVNEQVTWQADSPDVYVHKQVAICFTTPRYHNVNTRDHVQAYVQLRRPTDNATSDAFAFELLPLSADPNNLKRKRQKPLLDFSRFLQPVDNDMNQPLPEYYEMLRLQREQKPIKLEPRDKTPPNPQHSPHHVYSPPHAPQTPHYVELDQPREQQYQWNMSVDNMAGGLSIAGPSHMGQYSPHAQEMTWQMNQTALSPNMQAMSPNMSHMSPNMGHVSPNMQAMSPNMGHVSPNMQAMSPNMGHVSPNLQAMSPNVGHVSPNLQPMSPNMGHVSPNMHVPQNMGHVSPNLVQQQMAPMPQNFVEPTDCPSITGLLMADGVSMPQLNSSELSGLSSLLADARAPHQPQDVLTDSLNRLSTGDLIM